MISRETGSWAKIGFMDVGIDARVALLVIVWAVHMMWTTFYIMLGAMTLLTILQVFGMSGAEAGRRLRRKLGGNAIYIKRFDRIVS